MDIENGVWIKTGRAQIQYGIGSGFSMVFSMGFGMGLTFEEFRLLQVKTQNSEIQTNRVLFINHDKFYFSLNSLDSNTDIVPQIIGCKNLSNKYSILGCFGQQRKKSKLP